MRELVFSPAAIADLQGISDYTRTAWSAEQEVRYLDLLWQAIDRIRTDPDASKSRDDLLKGCRSVRESKHVIFFLTSDNEIEIVRILHAAMDFPRHFESQF